MPVNQSIVEELAFWGSKGEFCFATIFTFKYFIFMYIRQLSKTIIN